MATRKRHSKTQFVIPEEVAAPAPSGWAYRTEEGAAAPPSPAAAAPASSSSSSAFPSGALESGMRAFSYSLMAVGQFLLFTVQVATMPISLATGFMGRRTR